VIIVDNTIQSFFLQLSNGLPIHDYTGDKNDKILPALSEYLINHILPVADVRPKIDKDFKIKKLIEQK
jgi:hypothetical protein